MIVKLLTHTPDPEKLICACARLCYSDCEASEIMKDLTPEKTNKFVGMLESMNHLSPFEHAYFSFSIDGISRSCSHQIVRHRVASYSQRSQRYVGEGDFDYVIPQPILENQQAAEKFDKAMESAKESYNALYDVLLEAGFTDKESFENSRAALPNACCTSLVMTMNVRELQHFFKVRCCNRAQAEIRKVADQMLDICKKISPTLFKNAGAPCTTGSCGEGSMCCGNPRK